MPRIRGLQHLRLFVLPGQWEKARRFYSETLGLRLRHRDDGAGYAVYGLPRRATLGLERVGGKNAEERELAGRFVGVSFEVDDLRALYRAGSRAGVKFDSPPRTQGWGGSVAHFRDPAQNVLTLVEYRRRR